MKRIFMLLLLSVCMTGFVGCSSGVGMPVSNRLEVQAQESEAARAEAEQLSDTEYLLWTKDDWDVASDTAKANAAAAVMNAAYSQSGGVEIDGEQAAAMALVIDIYFEEEPDGSLRELALESVEALQNIESFLDEQS